MTIPQIICHFIVCKNPDAPFPERLVDALVQVGYLAELMEVTRSHFTASVIEIALGASRSRVYVDTSEDFEQGHDLSTGDWEIVEELIDPQNARTIRRLVVVRAWEHADLAAVQYLVEAVCAAMDGRLAERQAS